MKQVQHIRIVLADDHELFRDGFKTMIDDHPEIVLVGEAKNGRDLLQLTMALQPDVILTDIKMPELNGIEATKIITRDFPFAVVIGFSTYHEDHFIIDMLDAGAKGYILKSATKNEVVEAIYAVHARKPYFCHLTRQRISVIKSRNDHNLSSLRRIAFSDKEKAIIRLICQEYSTREISKMVCLSKRTVDGHRDRILQKTKAQNIAGVVTFAIRYGIYEV
jgi:DNA-binding NarL/FixJ family response regulator